MLKDRIFKVIAAVAIAVQFAFSQNVWDGTANTAWYNTNQTTFTIFTAEQLAGLAELVNSGNHFSGRTIRLMQNIILNDTENWQDWENNKPNNEWTAIGTYTTATNNRPFRGTFDGNGYIVSGVYVNKSNGTYQGFFSNIGTGGVIKDLGITDFYVKGGQYTGGLSGYNNEGTIRDCYTIGKVSGTSYTGGLVGYNSKSLISGSYTNATVSGTSNAGGLAGYSINNSINNSYAIGTVSGTSNVGGLVGYYTSSEINNSYAIGTVSGTSNVGGLVGENYGGYISNSYTSVDLTATGSYVGGLVGKDAVSSNIIYYQNNYYDSQISGQNDTGKGEGRTTAQMQSKEFVDTLNLFSAILSINAWNYSTGEYPTLSETVLSIKDYFADGDGTIGKPYVIETKEQLEHLCFFVNNESNYFSSNIKLANDIVLNDTANWQNWDTAPPTNEWTPIGKYPLNILQNTAFQGTFDGDGHVISGVYINSDNDNQGLFGYVSSGTIKNLGIKASYIKGGDNIGGLAGFSNGKIENSYSNAAVKGNYYVGGIAGTGANINNSYASGNVGGNYYVGGFVGNGTIAIANCYALGNVEGVLMVGGFIGENNGKVENSYSVGNVLGTNEIGGFSGSDNGAISGSYYNSQTSGQSDNAKGEGKTTAEMKQQSIYIDWDFDEIWDISAEVNNGYPFLRAAGNNVSNSISKFFARRNTYNSFAGIKNGQINLRLQAGNYTAELYNLQGRIIGRADINAVNGVNTIGLRIDNLSKGMFILNVKQAGVSVLKHKIAIK